MCIVVDVYRLACLRVSSSLEDQIFSYTQRPFHSECSQECALVLGRILEIRWSCDSSRGIGNKRIFEQDEVLFLDFG